jgi:hypothetical protein
MQLMDILQRRMAARGRALLAAEIQEAGQEFAAGHCNPVTAEDLMKDILS